MKRQTAKKPVLNGRERFLRACQCLPLERPPIWLMRQAGRALPEYRELKKKHSFLELVQTPELAAEVTVQPIRRFGFDAAILFSDILVVAEGLGQPYRFQDQGGIKMEYLIKSASDIERLEVAALAERLQYIPNAVRLVKSDLGRRTALIGFAGSPWTLANFMVEGGGIDEYVEAKRLFYTQPRLFSKLLGKLTQAVTQLLQLQIDAGVDAVQIFDSLGGLLGPASFEAGSGRWIRQIIEQLKGETPVIVFSKGVHGNWQTLVETGAQVIGIDWQMPLAEAAGRVPTNVALQGNLEPWFLTQPPKILAAQTRNILREMKGRPGHIFNLGHGVPPDAKLESIEMLVQTIHEGNNGL